MEFFEQIWSDTEGWVYLPVKSRDGFRKFMIPWPRKAEKVVDHVLRWAADENAEVFYSPAIYKSPKPLQEEVLGSWYAWVDFDGNAPTTWPKEIAPVPTIEIQSSTNQKRHVYWELKEFTPRKKIEEINRALAYALGADLSGWDANQFLRPPHTVNRKYAKPITAKILKNRIDRSYEHSAFSNVPRPKEAIQTSIELAELPDIEEVLAKARWDDELLELFRTPGSVMQHEGRDRSGGLQRLAYEGAEHGWTDEQIMAVLIDVDDRWGKYSNRSAATRKRILVDLINRARAKVGYDPDSELEGLAKALGVVEKVEEADSDQVLFSLDELADMRGIDNWTVDGLLTPGGIGHFTGRSGIGKTQLAMQLAACLASGRKEFLGRALPGRPMKVLVLSLEMNQYGLPHMMKPLRERFPDLDQKNLVIYAKGEMLPLDQDSGQAYLEALLEKIRPDVVFADSLSFMSRADLTSDNDMKTLFEFLQKARNTYGFGMVIIHHHRKKANDAQSKKQADTLHDVYGSFIITSTVDFVLNLEERPDDVDEKTITLTMLKSRYSAIPDPVKIVRNSKLHFDIAEDIIRAFTEKGEDDDGPNLGL